MGVLIKDPTMFVGVVEGFPRQKLEMDRSYVCHVVGRVNSRGLWLGDDPLTFSLPLLMLQLSLISIITRSIHTLLKPFGQPLIVSQILGGLILGPSILGHNSTFAAKIFPLKGRTVIETLSVFGFMLFIFLIGVKMDPSMVLKSSRKALAIGIMGFFVPYALAGIVATILSHYLSLDHDIASVLPFIAAMLSMTGFPVIACFLAELKILNSEIGRLASSSSIISDVCHWSIMFVNYAAKIASFSSLKSTIGSILSSAFLVILIVFGIRPAAMWAIRHTPEGKPVKDIYIFFVLVALMGCGFMGEFIGISSLFASFLLGLVIPDGPPLGAALVERLDCFVSVLLMPIFFAMCGLNMDAFAIQNLKNVIAIQLVVFFAFLGKIIGTILPPLFCRMPLRDAFSLALIMNSKGIVELAMLNDMKKSSVVNEECFSLLIISVVVVTGVISPLVKALYDPSRRYLAYKRRTIFHNKKNEQLHLLACIHSQDNVQAIVNLLEASNPTKESPINLVVLHLVKLAGRSTSQLIAHHPCERPSLGPSQSERIFNVFQKLEQQNHGIVSVHCFKAISPFATMHNDVCSIALEKRTTFIIIPFHKQCRFGELGESPYASRHLNRNVLDKAPCSVGILIDSGKRKKSRSMTEKPAEYQVAVLFFGGPDDREALAYARRMSEHPLVSVTLLHFSALTTDIVGGTARSKMLDAEILSKFRINILQNERVSYQEEVVRDGLGVLSVTRSIECMYDLVMVGRRHTDSQFMSELRKSNEREELGTIGEILAASDLKDGASVLVVQQQTRVWGMHDPEDSTHLRRISL
ncbi:cation/H(+) antiporter 15-like isoform X1 [Malania oleifera]|uniref:cation/H(+) antiporter 15-like isoform X1 n=1 Tax=Malania oleifera TaxID=397392 RepID=UPI0025ADF808|nr:cation/H(+) antiporter 15-like isoform X1 [Malania oleifera]